MRQRRRAERGRFTSSRDASQPAVNRREVEERQRLLLIRVAIAAAAFVLAVLVVGWYITQFQPPRRTVATVDGQGVKLSELVDYTSLFAVEGSGNLRPDLALNDLVRNRVLLGNAGELGVEVTDAELEERLALRFEPLPAGATTPSDTLSDEGRSALAEYLGLLNVDEASYREWVTGQLYVVGLQEHFQNSQPETIEQVHVEWIVTESSATAQNAKDFIEIGQDFADVAAQFNEDRLLSDENGVVGWVPQRALSELDTVLFGADLELNTPIGPLTTSFGSVVLQVTEGPSEQPLSLVMAGFVASEDFQDWLDAQVAESVPDGVSLTTDDFEWVVDQIT